MMRHWNKPRLSDACHCSVSMVGRVRALAAAAWWTGVAVLGGSAGAATIVLKAAAVHVGNGQTFTPGMVLIEGGRIVAVGGAVEAPPDAVAIDLAGGEITPGLIDANAALEPMDLMPTPPPDAANARLAAANHPNAPLGAASDPTGAALLRFFGLDEHGHAAATGTAALDPQDPAVFYARHADDRMSLAGRLLAWEHIHEDADPACALCAGGSAPFAGNMQESALTTDHSAPNRPAADDSPLVAGQRPGLSLSEHSSEVVPHLRGLDSINLRSPDFERLLREGVTTVYASPNPDAVIGPRGAVVHTGGPPAGRVVRAEAAVHAAIGSEPSWRGRGNRPPFGSRVDMFSRRPNNRMGLIWVFRKAFHDADRLVRGVEPYGADTPSDEALAVLAKVRAGEVPLRIQARALNDITSALRLADEFGLRFTLEEGVEAYKLADELKARGVPVIFGPIYEDAQGSRARSGETDENRLDTLPALLDAGLEVALSAVELRDEDGLARQAMAAMRMGVPRDQALKLVTLNAARMIGIDDQTGTIEAGKRADLVVWSGPPFDAASRPLLVMIGGETVYQVKTEE